MDDNVVQLSTKTAEKMLWVCDCGCTTFHLFQGEPPRCANCDSLAGTADHSGWTACLPPRMSQKSDTDMFSIVGAPEGDTDFPRRRMARRALEESAAMVVVGFKSGEVAVWSEAACRAQADWVKSRLALATAIVDAVEY